MAILQPGLTSGTAYNPKRALLAGGASIAVVCLLIAVKAYAYGAGGSAGVLAALVDSVADAAASLFSLFAIHLSLKPADRHHRHGHGKVEGLAALAQAVFILGAAVFLGLEAVARFRDPQPVRMQGLGIAVMAVSILLSVVLVRIQGAALRSAPSLAVASDRAHYGADIAVNLLVLCVLLLQAWGAPLWIDPAAAVLVALWLCRTAFIVACGGVDMLMDREVGEAQRKHIAACISSVPAVHGFHDLRTRMAGMNLNISFDIEVDPDLTLRAAHAIAKAVEENLLAAFPNAEIMIHVDPEGEPEDGRHQQEPSRP